MHSNFFVSVADFGMVFCVFHSRFDRLADRWGVRGRQFRPFPADFWGFGGFGPEFAKYVFNSFQKAAT